MTDAIDVSVVVPVYNPGPYIEPCIASLLAQSLPADRLELIFVDDGSTDGTGDRLDRLAAEHAQLRVIHRANSGWSGQPRNDGIEAARGTFIQFVDQDDSMGPEALQRLAALGERTTADVVIGKVISNGRKVPRGLTRLNRDHTSIRELELEGSLTPHKMFRRSMLMEHDIRFPTQQRLEDQPFVLRSYFAARNVAILADYPCYLFTKREDKGNLSWTRLDPVVYYANLRAIVDVVEAGTTPGPLRDRILGRFYRSGVLARLSEPVLLKLSAADRAERFREARAFAVERFGAEIEDRLSPIARLRSSAIRAGDLDGLVALSTSLQALRFEVEVTTASWHRGAWRLRGQVRVRTAGGAPLRLVRRGADLHLDLGPTPLGDRTRLARLDEVSQSVSASLLLRDPSSHTEWAAPRTGMSIEWVDVPAPDLVGEQAAATTAATQERPGDRLVEPRITLRARLAVGQVAGGRPLPAGDWALTTQVSWFGVTRPARVRPAAGLLDATTVAGQRNRPVRLITVAKGDLGIEVHDSRLAALRHRLRIPQPIRQRLRRLARH